MLQWFEHMLSDLPKDAVMPLCYTMLQCYCTVDILQFILQTILSLLQETCSTECLLSMLRLLTSISHHQHVLNLTEEQKEQIMELSFQAISMIAQTNEEYGLIIGIPFFCQILFCYPHNQFTLRHLNTLVSIGDLVPSLQNTVYLLYHFLLNNWQSEEDVTQLVKRILFNNAAPTELINETQEQDNDLIKEVLKMEGVHYYREYSYI